MIRSFLHRLCTLAPFPPTFKAASSKPAMHVLLPPFSREDYSPCTWSYGTTRVLTSSGELVANQETRIPLVRLLRQLLPCGKIENQASPGR